MDDLTWNSPTVFSLTKLFEYEIFQERQMSWKSSVRITDGGCKIGKKALDMLMYDAGL